MPDRHAAPSPYRLIFLLPAVLGLVPQGRHVPCLMGCLVTIDRAGLVTVAGPSRERVFEQTARFLRILMRRNPPPPTSIAAVMSHPASPWGRIGWQIIVGADISFAPTSIEPTIVPAGVAHG